MVLIAGSVNRDLRFTVPSLPRWGETVMAAESKRMIGGKGANQAIAAARAGARVEMAAAVGRDGHDLVARLSLEGIDTRQVKLIDAADTGVAIVVVDHAGENLIVVEPGANQFFTGADQGEIEPGTFTLMQGETPPSAVLDTARATKERGGSVVLNAAPAGAWVHDLSGLVDHLVVNEGEFAAIFGQHWSDEPPPSLDWPSIVVTRGGDGSVWLSEHGSHQVPAHPTEARDTVGAGDAFCGALVAQLARGRPMPAALRAATVFAAAAVGRVGAADSYPTYDEFVALMDSVGFG